MVSVQLAWSNFFQDSVYGNNMAAGLAW